MKKLSIIVAMYKAKEYIKGCVSSLLMQNLDDYEIILVDDCSPDDTFEYAKNLYGDNEKIKIIKQEKNGGPGIARNKGLEIANGEYITFCDVDDYMLPNVLFDEYKYAKEKDLDLFLTYGINFIVSKETKDNLSLYNEKQIVKYSDEKYDEKYIDEPNDIKIRLDKYLNFDYRWSVWGKIYKKEMLDKYDIRFSSLKIAEDQIFVLESLICARNMGGKLMYAYCYRTGNDSLTKSKVDIKSFVRFLDSYIGAVEILKEKLENKKNFPYVNEYFEKLLKFQKEVLENGYALPAYKELGYEKVNNSDEVNMVFKKYYKDNALNEKEKLFSYFEKNKYKDVVLFDLYANLEELIEENIHKIDSYR